MEEKEQEWVQSHMALGSGTLVEALHACATIDRSDQGLEQSPITFPITFIGQPKPNSTNKRAAAGSLGIE